MPRTMSRQSVQRIAAVAVIGMARPLLGSAGVAHAQTSQVLVSNLGQPMATAGGTEHGVAQGFRTGANTDGYTLTSIDLRLGNSFDPMATLHRGSPTGSTVAGFTAPSRDGTGFAAPSRDGTGFAAHTFTPTTPTTLEPNTDYWVVAAGGTIWVWSVTGPGDDATPAPGWSIADRGQGFNPNSGSWEDNDGDWAYQIRVNGTIRQPPPPPPPTGGGGGGGTDPDPDLEPEPLEVAIVGVPEVAVAGESYELTAQSDAENLVYAWSVAYGEGGSVEPSDTQAVV